VCKKCNEGFSADEEYFAAFLGCVLAGSTELERQTNSRLATTLRRSPALRARIDACRTESPTLFGDIRIVWTPEKDRIHRVVVKNARGHAFFEYGEPILKLPNYVWSAPIEFLGPEERETFERVPGGALWPEVDSRMLTRVLTGQDLMDGWVVVQDGVYRYVVAQEDLIVVRSVINEYLATEVRWSD